MHESTATAASAPAAPEGRPGGRGPAVRNVDGKRRLHVAVEFRQISFKQQFNRQARSYSPTNRQPVNIHGVVAAARALPRPEAE